MEQNSLANWNWQAWKEVHKEAWNDQYQKIVLIKVCCGGKILLCMNQRLMRYFQIVMKVWSWERYSTSVHSKYQGYHETSTQKSNVSYQWINSRSNWLEITPDFFFKSNQTHISQLYIESIEYWGRENREFKGNSIIVTKDE